ncbi:hypothetical protein V6U78_03735 [Marinospirillum sp. MEB164]|uniref:TadE-like protein n=1 Tax=Marinospirillum alkalitolerans TaxID=3123374 RepID=A0ABW8PVX7_9GAMM
MASLLGYVLLPILLFFTLMVWILLASAQQWGHYLAVQHQQQQQAERRHEARLLLQAITEDLAAEQADYLDALLMTDAACAVRLQQISRFTAIQREGCLGWQEVEAQIYQLHLHLDGSFVAWQARWRKTPLQGWQRLEVRSCAANAQGACL